MAEILDIIIAAAMAALTTGAGFYVKRHFDAMDRTLSVLADHSVRIAVLESEVHSEGRR